VLCARTFSGGEVAGELGEEEAPELAHREGQQQSFPWFSADGHIFAKQLSISPQPMNPLNSPAKIAGALSLLSAALALPFWYTLLFAATPSSLSAWEAALQQLQFSFSSGTPGRELLVLWALVPIVSAGLGLIYLTPVARSREVAVGALTASAAVALTVFILAGWSEAIFYVLPVFFGAKNVRMTSNPSFKRPDGSAQVKG
jgi:hypothetical protein